MRTLADSGGAASWQAALARAKAKNAARYLGCDDWRLPNAEELQGLVDHTRSPDTPQSAAIGPLFQTTEITDDAGQVDYPFFWSGTTHSNWADTPGNAGAYVCFGRTLGHMDGCADMHGAGALRSDAMSGDAADYPEGHGLQRDARACRAD